jgi:hypothetical protein
MKRNHEKDQKQQLKWIAPQILTQVLRDETDNLSLLKDAHSDLVRAVADRPSPIECTDVDFWWSWEESDPFHKFQILVKNHDEILLHVTIEINEKKEYDEGCYHPFTHMMAAILEIYKATTNVRILRNVSATFDDLFFDWEYIGDNVMPLLTNVDLVEVDGSRYDVDMALYKGMLCNDLKKFRPSDGYTYSALLLEVFEVGWRSPSLNNIDVPHCEWKAFALWCDLDVMFDDVVDSFENSDYIGEFVDGKTLNMPGCDLEWRLVRKMNGMPPSMPKPTPLNIDYYTDHEAFSCHQVIRWLHILSCIAVVLKAYAIAPEGVCHRYSSTHLKILSKLETLFQASADTFETFEGSDFIFTDDGLKLTDAVDIHRS